MPATPRSFGVTIDVDATVCERNTAFQHVLIADTEAFGRIVMLDGELQSAESDERIYHEAHVHPAVLAHGQVRRVLVAGTGEGAMLRELVKHRDIEGIVAVDIDPEAVDLFKLHLPGWSDGAFDDPRVELRFEDIRSFLADTDERFDLVIVDVTDPNEGAPSEGLYAPPFFEAIRARVAPGGLVVVQAGEVDPWRMQVSRELTGVLGQVFDHVALAHFFVPSFLNLWGAAYCWNGRAPQFVPDDLQARFVAALASGQLRDQDLWVYSPTWHRACFELPRLLRERLEAPNP